MSSFSASSGAGDSAEEGSESTSKRKARKAKLRASAKAKGADKNITWSIAYDITPSHDESYNRKALSVVRKEQNRFSRAVVLPDGLTEEQIEAALKGVPVVTKVVAGEDEDGTLLTAEPETATATGATLPPSRNYRGFEPQPGVKYV